jgi:hypothetical protein
MEKKASVGFRLDERIFFTMLALGLVSLLVLAFRYSGRDSCSVRIDIKSADGKFLPGNTISFTAKVSNPGKTYEWDFGDHTTVEEGVPSTRHIYKTPGRYTVRVLVNGTCEEVQLVDIDAPPVIFRTDLEPVAEIPDSAPINELVTFNDRTPDATSWEWSFEDPGKIDAREQTATHKYNNPGFYDVFLRINGRSDRTTKRMIRIYDPNPVKEEGKVKTQGGGGQTKYIPVPVNPTTPPLEDQMEKKDDKKVVEDPKVKKVALLNDDQVKALLLQVKAGNKTAEDFAQYLDNGNLSMGVTLNGKRISFKQLCKELQGVKKKKVQQFDVTITTDDQTNEITDMSVVLDVKKNIFDIN